MVSQTTLEYVRKQTICETEKIPKLFMLLFFAGWGWMYLIKEITDQFLIK